MANVFPAKLASSNVSDALADRDYLSSSLQSASIEESTFNPEYVEVSLPLYGTDVLLYTMEVQNNFTAVFQPNENYPFYNRWLVVRNGEINRYDFNFGFISNSAPPVFGLWNGYNEHKVVTDIQISPALVTFSGIAVDDDIWPYQEIVVSVIPNEGVYNFEVEITISFSDATTLVLNAMGTQVIPFPYMPQNDYKESIEFLTDVTTLTDGSERRYCLQPRPRVSVEFTHKDMDLTTIGRQNALAYQIPGRPILVPLWFYAERVRELQTGVSEVYIDTTRGEFAQDVIALLYRNASTYEFISITAVDTDHITLEDPVSITSPYDTWVVPCRVGYAARPTTRRAYQSHGELEVAYQLVQNTEIAGGSFASSHDGIPVWNACVIDEDDGRGEQSFSSPIQAFKPSISDPAVFRNSDHVNNQHRMSLYFDDKDAVWDFKQKIHYLKGRQKKFWAPDFTGRFILESQAVSGTAIIDVVENGYLELLAAEAQRQTLVMSDGTNVQYSNVSTIAALDSDTTRITLQDNLSFDLNVGQVRIGFLVLSRLASDKIEIDYNDDYATCEFNIIEVKE
jgi:hypothetical protein